MISKLFYNSCITSCHPLRTLHIYFRRKLFKWDPRTHRPPLPYDPRADELYVRTIEKP